jgi:hypothetical protein
MKKPPPFSEGRRGNFANCEILGGVSLSPMLSHLSGRIQDSLSRTPVLGVHQGYASMLIIDKFKLI